MKKLFWKAALHMVRQVSSIDINEQLVKELEYVHAELQVFKAQFRKINKRPSFTDEQRKLLAEKGRALGKRIHDLATIVTPATILRWHRELVAKKFDSSQSPKRKVGRPKTRKDIEGLIITIALDNPRWGYTRIVGTVKNLGIKISRTTVANILERNGINPSPDRSDKGMSWADFIRLHKDVLWATDFFTTEAWTTFGLITYYVLFFIHIGSRKVVIAGITPNPSDEWMAQIARNVTAFDGELIDAKYLIHDRDGKYTEQFDALMRSIKIKPIRLPPRSPNLNAYAESFVAKIKSECLNYTVFIDEESMRKAVSEFICHYHEERPHQGLDNCIPFPDASAGCPDGEIKCKERLGGLLKYYYRETA